MRFFWLPYCMISYGWYWHAHIWCCVCYQCLKRHLSAQFLSWVEFQLKDTLSRFLVLKLMRWFLSHLCKCRQCQLKVSSIQNESMRSSFLPKCQPNILRISALPFNKLSGPSDPSNSWLAFWKKQWPHKFILTWTDLYNASNMVSICAWFVKCQLRS